MVKNEKEIMDCLIESYSRELETAIRIMANERKDEILKQEIKLKKKSYDEITYNSNTVKCEELADNHFEIGSKFSWNRLLEYVKVQAELETMRAECYEDDEF